MGFSNRSRAVAVKACASVGVRVTCVVSNTTVLRGPGATVTVWVTTLVSGGSPSLVALRVTV